MVWWFVLRLNCCCISCLHDDHYKLGSASIIMPLRTTNFHVSVTFTISLSRSLSLILQKLILKKQLLNWSFYALIWFSIMDICTLQIIRYIWQLTIFTLFYHYFVPSFLVTKENRKHDCGHELENVTCGILYGIKFTKI